MFKFFIIIMTFGVEPSASLHDDFEGTDAQCKQYVQELTVKHDFKHAFACVQVGDNL